MSNWDRKEADHLADAIGKHIKANPEFVRENQLLAIVRMAAHAASTTVNTNAAELNRCRAGVCAVCRGSNLYACDVAVGWSDDCAFVFANTSQFAVL